MDLEVASWQGIYLMAIHLDMVGYQLDDDS